MSQKKYYIVSRKNRDFVLGIKDFSNENRAQVVLQTIKSRAESQLWTKEPHNAFGFIIRNVNSGLVLDISGGEKNGHKLILYPKHGGNNQIWNYSASDFTIRSYSKDLCVDISRGDIAEDAKIIAYRHHGGINQQWDFVEQEDKEGKKTEIHNTFIDNSKNFMKFDHNTVNNTVNNSVHMSMNMSNQAGCCTIG